MTSPSLSHPRSEKDLLGEDDQGRRFPKVIYRLEWYNRWVDDLS